MAQISRTYTFTDDTTAYGSQVDSEVQNIVNSVNNLDAGVTVWTQVKAVNGSTTPLVADNSSGANNVLEAKVNGVTKARVDGTGNLVLSTSETIVNATANYTALDIYKQNSGTANEGGPIISLSNLGPLATTRVSGTHISAIQFNASQPTSGSPQVAALISVNADGDQTGTSTPSLFAISTTKADTPSVAVVVDSNQATTFTGVVYPNKGISGTVTNDNATTGIVGEYIAASVSTPTNFPPTTNYGDVTSIALTAGDWDLSACVDGNNNAVANQAQWAMGISTTSGNSSTGLVQGQTLFFCAPGSSTYHSSFSIPFYRASLASPTTFYLKIRSDYSGTAPQFVGFIAARRVR